MDGGDSRANDTLTGPGSRLRDDPAVGAQRGQVLRWTFGYRNARTTRHVRMAAAHAICGMSGRGLTSLVN